MSDPRSLANEKRERNIIDPSSRIFRSLQSRISDTSALLALSVLPLEFYQSQRAGLRAKEKGKRNCTACRRSATFTTNVAATRWLTSPGRRALVTALVPKFQFRAGNFAKLGFLEKSPHRGRGGGRGRSIFREKSRLIHPRLLPPTLPRRLTARDPGAISSFPRSPMKNPAGSRGGPIELFVTKARPLASARES